MQRFALFVMLAVLPMSCQTQDWPDWRGKSRDAVWEASGIVEKFDADFIESKWSVPIGSGYSGPTVADGKVYVTDRQERPLLSECVVCFDERTGEQIWAHQYDCVYENVGYPAGPRASVSSMIVKPIRWKPLCM